jgi:hypothetical protein
MRRRILSSFLLLNLTFFYSTGYSFCGFYVAKADTQLFNNASQVVMVRHDDKTVMTMANDFKGALQEFAVVIPVPTVLEKGQIRIADKTLIDHLDAYTAPRLVEYFDDNPCQPAIMYRALPQSAEALSDESQSRQKSYGVTIEAEYTIGEYDIIILSARESQGLENWLNDNGYRIPDGAASVLGSYIKQNMHFFVAKVNLTQQTKLGFRYLRPIQVAYESPKFMLPIRLGTVNAKQTQELFVYLLTRKGRVETTNYRTVKLPSNLDLPVFIKSEFGDFYRTMFEQQVKETQMKTVFLEYAWDMNWCDPCAADPLSTQELRKLGVFWLNKEPSGAQFRNQARDVFVTRLHLRYDAQHFPEDLKFQQTGDRSNFQGRYVLRHPWTGNDNCSDAKQYRQRLRKRQEQEAINLARLTGWDLREIREKMHFSPLEKVEEEKTWWEKLWED